jgi:hypothetical protein
MATDASLVLWFVVFLAAMGTIVFSASSAIEISKLQACMAALVVWPLTFPVIVKAKKFKQRYYWLPKSRLWGYFVYLIIPISAIVSAFATAIHFTVGL